MRTGRKVRPIAPDRNMKLESPSSSRVLQLAVVALVGLNLRPFITGIGPLAGDMNAQIGLGLQGMALLTLVPMLLMGCFAFAGPALQARVGTRRAVIAALAILAVASFLRLFVSSGEQIVATAALLGFGAAIIQAVFPGIVKQQFPHHVGMVMGLYSAMLMVMTPARRPIPMASFRTTSCGGSLRPDYVAGRAEGWRSLLSVRCSTLI